MKRRKAIGLIAMAAAGVTVFSACEFTKVPLLDNFAIDKSTFKKLKKLCSAVLPIPEEVILENMRPEEFILIMVDDCMAQEDIDQFKSGMEAFFTKYPKPETWTSEMLEQGIEEDSFLKAVKDYNVWYYKGLESYLDNYTDYEFVPGRFLGCVNV